MLLFQMLTSVKFHIASNCITLSSYQVRQKPVHAKDLVLITKCLTHGKNSVIMNLLSIEIAYLFPEVTIGVVK